MEKRHGNCTGNSSGKTLRNDAKKCYSLPILQKENEKLKFDLNVLQAAHDEKENLLAESLLKSELLETELKRLLKDAGANKEKVETKDAYTIATIDTKDASTATSIVIETQVDMRDASTFVKIQTKNVSTLTSFVNVNSETDVEESTGSDDESTSSSVACKILLFSETIREMPYDEETEIKTLDQNLKDLQISSNMVISINCPKKNGKTLFRCKW